MAVSKAVLVVAILAVLYVVSAQHYERGGGRRDDYGGRGGDRYDEGYNNGGSQGGNSQGGSSQHSRPAFDTGDDSEPGFHAKFSTKGIGGGFTFGRR